MEEVAADIARRDPGREPRDEGRKPADREKPHRRRARKPKGDLSDSRWKKVARMLPAEPRRGRHRSTDEREVVNAIRHRWETGCAWRDLPERYPPWPTVYTYFRNWLKDGTLKKLREELRPPRPSEVHFKS
ncbi:MAG: transposase [Planctomycetota bacterium]